MDDKAAPAVEEEVSVFKSRNEKSSYALGMVLGNRLRSQSIDVDLDLYVQGLRDALSGGKTLLTETEARTAVNEMQNELKKKRAAAQSAAAALTGIKISFKLDPRLTRSMYMGDRWISPPTYTSTVKAGEELVVEARAQGFDDMGKPKKISPAWMPEDPDMVTVTPGQGNEVRITVKRAGESKLTVSSQEVSKELLIKSRYEKSTIQVEISQ